MVLKTNISGFGMIIHLMILLTGLQVSLIIIEVLMKTVVLFTMMVNGTMHPVKRRLTTFAKEKIPKAAM